MSVEIKEILAQRTYAFAIRIINAYKYISKEKMEYVLTKQLLRSGTAIGAMCREAEFAQSRADFISKLSIVLKEANETNYWIELLHDTDYISDDVFLSIQDDCKRIIALLVSIVKNTKQNTEPAKL